MIDRDTRMTILAMIERGQPVEQIIEQTGITAAQIREITRESANEQAGLVQIQAHSVNS